MVTQRRRSCRISRIASRLSATATANGTADWLGDDGTMLGATGLLASSTVDFACAAASLAAAANSPLDSISCCILVGAAGGLDGVGAGLVAGAFLAGVFLAGVFFATAFFAG